MFVKLKKKSSKFFHLKKQIQVERNFKSLNISERKIISVDENLIETKF